MQELRAVESTCLHGVRLVCWKIRHQAGCLCHVHLGIHAGMHAVAAWVGGEGQVVQASEQCCKCVKLASLGETFATGMGPPSRVYTGSLPGRERRIAGSAVPTCMAAHARWLDPASLTDSTDLASAEPTFEAICSRTSLHRTFPTLTGHPQLHQPPPATTALTWNA